VSIKMQLDRFSVGMSSRDALTTELRSGYRAAGKVRKQWP